MNSTSELDRFIHKIQVKSRATVDGKIIRIEPISETVKFDATPSKDRHDNGYAVVYARYLRSCRATT